MRQIQDHIESYGSVRLSNCFRQAVHENSWPYTTVQEYLTDSRAVRFLKLLRIPNLGKKTAIEFDELIVSYSDGDTFESRNRDSVPAVSHEDHRPNRSHTNSAKTDRPTVGVYSSLSQREKDILERRFAIGPHDRQTLEEISLQYDVTRERIRQLESKALKKLRSPLIAPLWQRIIEDNLSEMINGVLGGKPLAKNPASISGESALAISVVYKNVSRFLEDKAQRYEGYWVNPNWSIIELRRARNRLASCVRDQDVLPLSITEVAEALEVSGRIVEAAATTLSGYKVYDGWIIRGDATSRKRRIVNILTLFHNRFVKSPVSLWDLKVVYWSKYDDKCSGRDLLIALQEHKAHFLNLRELGWMCLSTEPQKEPRRFEPMEWHDNAPDELYRKPVKSSRGLANCVYDIFEKHGPQRLADAAEIFNSEYPNYSVSSMYPMLVYFAAFFRFAPGVLGIQAHRRDANAVASARQILLRERDLDLYLLSRAAGPPWLHYPLWDHDMEKLWAGWLVKKEDSHRLGALLSVANVGEWTISESERIFWERQKREHEGQIPVPTMRIFSERRIDSGMLTTALAASSVLGLANWMFLNQALGWRVETTRVGLVLALLIKMGVLRPTGTWSKSHILTNHGRRISKEIFGRSIFSESSNRNTIVEFLEEYADSNAQFGWAQDQNFDQLLNQVTDISGRQDDQEEFDEEESTIDAAYEGFMGNEVRRLIEGD